MVIKKKVLTQFGWASLILEGEWVTEDDAARKCSSRHHEPQYLNARGYTLKARRKVDLKLEKRSDVNNDN